MSEPLIMMASGNPKWDLSANDRAAIAAAVHALRRRDDYKFRCQDCGAPHNLDTSIPSEVWNAICTNRPGVKPGAAGIGMPEVGALCTLCIDERLTKAGLRCDVAEFYFVGKALTSRLYAEDEAEKRREASGCNTHDELVAALRYVLMVAKGAEMLLTGEAKGPRSLGDLDHGIIQQGEAVLAKAEASR